MGSKNDPKADKSKAESAEPGQMKLLVKIVESREELLGTERENGEPQRDIPEMNEIKPRHPDSCTNSERLMCAKPSTNDVNPMHEKDCKRIARSSLACSNKNKLESAQSIPNEKSVNSALAN